MPTPTVRKSCSFIASIGMLRKQSGHGDLQVANGPESGAVFTVSLPLASAVADVIIPVQHPATPSGLQALAIDDEADVAEVLSDLLRAAGINSTIYDRAEDALAAVQSGKEIPLTAMEYRLLRVFVEHRGRVLNRDQLLELAHDRGWDPFDRSIDIRISRLRRKIETDPGKPCIIRTVRGIGYVFDPQD